MVYYTGRQAIQRFVPTYIQLTRATWAWFPSWFYRGGSIPATMYLAIVRCEKNYG